MPEDALWDYLVVLVFGREEFWERADFVGGWLLDGWNNDLDWECCKVEEFIRTSFTDRF